MSSYYVFEDEPEEVHVNELGAAIEVRCTRCRGRGWVEVCGQETDCIDCEGYGTVLS